MADILTLDEYKALSNITNTTRDVQYAALLPGVNKAILGYTGRDFGAPQVTEERTYAYDFSGMLDIDDASAITQVSGVVPNASDYVLPPESWVASPQRRDDAEVYWYISFPALALGFSPAMGFMRNLDLLYSEGRLDPQYAQMKVTATWGWPVVPDDVKVAAKWTLDDWVARRPETAAPAESIESYSRGSLGVSNLSEAVAWGIPMRARDLLSPYTKINV